jgi:hypothetical protein
MGIETQGHAAIGIEKAARRRLSSAEITSVLSQFLSKVDQCFALPQLALR